MDSTPTPQGQQSQETGETPTIDGMRFTLQLLLKASDRLGREKAQKAFDCLIAMHAAMKPFGDEIATAALQILYEATKESLLVPKGSNAPSDSPKPK